MSSSQDQIQSSNPVPSGSEVLKALSSLYDTRLSPKAFWEKFCGLMAQLCKSPCLIVLSSEQQGHWQRLEMNASDEQLATRESDLVEHSLSMLSKLQNRDFVSGPCPYQVDGIEEPYFLCSKLKSDRRNQQLLFIAILEHGDVARFNEYLVRFQMASSVYFAHRQFQRINETEHSVVDDELLYALKLSDSIVGQDKFQLAAMILVNELCKHYGCSRVSLGWKRYKYFETVAISHLEKFDLNSPQVAELNNIFEETADQDEVLVQPALRLNEKAIRFQHEKLQRQRSLQQLISIPLHRQGEIVAVVCLELEEKPLQAKYVHLTHVALAQVLPWMHHLHKSDRWPHQKMLSGIYTHARWWLGPRHTAIKVTALLIAGTLICTSLIQRDYRIEATASLETDHIAYLSAPFNGFIKEVHAHSGDQVEAQQVLMSMDSEELQLRALEEEANVNRFQRESEKARSNRDLVGMKIGLARVDQADAELKRIQYYLTHAKVRSPFAGIVVEGEREELLGAPVSKGDLLIKVANPTDLHLKIKVSEEDIDELREGATGELTLLSQPGQYHAIIIEKIIPLATTDSQEGNVFSVKARLVAQAESWWRPGMSGVVKLDVAPRSLLWIALHRSWESLRMILWF